MTVDVQYRPEFLRFEAVGGEAFLTYEIADGVVCSYDR